MSVKRTLVEIAHDESYGDALLEHINNNLRGKDMRAERIVTNQKIIDAIEAKVKATFSKIANMKIGTVESAVEVLNHLAYVSGLRFAKELIEKRIEVTE